MAIQFGLNFVGNSECLIFINDVNKSLTLYKGLFLSLLARIDISFSSRGADVPSRWQLLGYTHVGNATKNPCST